MRIKYKKMLKGMQRKETAHFFEKVNESWFLYIVRCKDGTLYTGITKDLHKRLTKHNSGTASHYTRTRRPVELLYQESCVSRTQALIRECAVKAFPRKKKEELIEQKS